MKRKYAMSLILKHLANHGITMSHELYDAMDVLNISHATFYRAIKELAMRGAILQYRGKTRSGLSYTSYGINFYAIDLNP